MRELKKENVIFLNEGQVIKTEGVKTGPVIGRCWLNTDRGKCLPDCGREKVYAFFHGVGTKTVWRGECSLSLLKDSYLLVKSSAQSLSSSPHNFYFFFGCIMAICIGGK